MTTGRSHPAIAFYDREAESLSTRYDSLDFDRLHGILLPFLPQKGRALDVGAGSGRDARALAERGLEVVAVEPSEGMRRQAARHTGGPAVLWIDDTLPDLALLPPRPPFDLILLSAVWMHIPSTDRPRALSRLSEILSPGGHLFLTFRNVKDEPLRGMYPVDPRETLISARKNGLSLLVSNSSGDGLGRADLEWTALLFRKVAPEKKEETPT
ncbi:MAG: class I SAM-dependent methyltransferase [Leptospirillia bacterium]